MSGNIEERLERVENISVLERNDSMHLLIIDNKFNSRLSPYINYLIKQEGKVQNNGLMIRLWNAIKRRFGK